MPTLANIGRTMFTTHVALCSSFAVCVLPIVGLLNSFDGCCLSCDVHCVLMSFAKRRGMAATMRDGRSSHFGHVR